VSDPVAALRLSRGAWLVLALGALAGTVLAVRVGVANYSSDHWAYVDIAAALLRDPGAMNQIRSFYHPAYTNTGWPFGWPALQAPLVGLLGPTAPVAVLLNVGALAVAGALLMALMRSLGLSQWLGLGALATILALPPTMPSALSGAVNILGCVLVLAGLVIAVLWRDRPSIGTGIALGLVAAAMANVRFDLVIVAVPLALVAAWLRALDRRGLLAFGAVVLVAGILPWSLYSRTVLGSWWSSDNSGIATALEPWPGYLTYGLTPPTQTLVDDPMRWLSRVIGNVPEVLTSLEGTLGGGAVILSVVLATGIALTAGRRGWRVPRRRTATGDLPAALLASAGFAVGIGAAQYAILISINNWEDRYWLPTAAVLVVLAWLGLAGLAASVTGPAGRRLRIGLVAAAVLATTAATSPETVGALLARSPTTAWQACRSPGPGAAMYAQHTMAAYFAALGDRTVYLPDNADSLTIEQWQEIIDAYGVSTAVMPTAMWRERPALHGLVAHVECPYLFGAS